MNEITLLKSKARSWGEQIRAQIRSGQSVREFCEVHQLNRHTFSYWKSKLKPGRFIPVSGITTHAAPKSPRILLPNGVQIELGAGLESVVVHQLIQKLCGVGREKS